VERAAHPDGFEFQLLPEDWDQFEILMRNAMHRTPCLETAEVKLLLNGPRASRSTATSSSAKRRSSRASSSARASIRRASRTRRRRTPDRRLDRRRRAAVDVWDVDIRRFAPLHANAAISPTAPWRRSACTTRCAGRARSSRACGRCAARRCTIACRAGAVFGTKLNWERANYFLPRGARAAPHARHARVAAVVLEEQRAAARTWSCSTRRRSPNSCQGTRCAARAAAAVRERDRRRRRQDRVHGDAQRARRLRERRHDRAPRARHVLRADRLGAGDARRGWIERHIGADDMPCSSTSRARIRSSR
jgi:hypothetical protein